MDEFIDLLRKNNVHFEVIFSNFAGEKYAEICSPTEDDCRIYAIVTEKNELVEVHDPIEEKNFEDWIEDTEDEDYDYEDYDYMSNIGIQYLLPKKALEEFIKKGEVK